ncbi:unnamed protein product [Nippostrongylus brasiliensis]|uniref:Uncharacterized protein n=1 Tax=Nippostrongylus brasiliensis TaxID=27835 RepID=A0A0N4XGR8_NIPBR|nr:unnamed protein product [Nippostrongylus brasiliensis]
MVTQPRRVMVQEPTTSVDSSSPSEASTPSEARHSQATPSMTMHVAQTRAPPVPQMALLEGSEDSSADSGNHASLNTFLTDSARMLLAHHTFFILYYFLQRLYV